MKILIYKKKQLVNSTGGIESVLCWLASQLSNDGNDVTMATADNVEGGMLFDIPKEITIKNFKNIKLNNLSRIISLLLAPFSKKFNHNNHVSNKLKAYINDNRFDLIISAGPKDSLDILYNKNYDIPHICMFHSHPETYLPVNNKNIKDILSDVVPKVSVFQALMPKHKTYLQNRYNTPVSVIGNFVKEATIDKSIVKNDTIIYVGTIVSNKNQDFLIDSFAKIADKYPTWKIELWGQIANKKYYDSLVIKLKKYKLENRVLFKGVTTNILAEIEKSKICAFISKREGFSIALTEIMSMGVPCIGLKKAPFVGEIIINEKTGLLINEDQDELALALSKLIESEKLRLSIGNAASKSLTEYSEDKIYNKWKSLIKEVMKK